MKKRDDTHQLEGVIEFDDAFFGGPTVGKKRGRGTEKTKVFVALSLDKKGNPLYLKMKPTENIKCKSVKKFAAKHIAKGSVIRSDGYRSFSPALTDYVHEPVKYILTTLPKRLRIKLTIISPSQLKLNEILNQHDHIKMPLSLN